MEWVSRDALVSLREGKSKESSREISLDILRRRGTRELEEDLPYRFFVGLSLRRRVLQMSRRSTLRDISGISALVSGELSALGRAIPVVIAQ